MRLPKHTGIIPNGNRRWAKGQGMDKSKGYGHGISPEVPLYRMCRKLRIGEISSYGFTTDNTKRPPAQRQAFTRACVATVEELVEEGASLLVLGNTKSPMFSHELLPFTARHDFRKGGVKINSLVGYNWEWDSGYKDKTMRSGLKTAEVSRIDLIIQWGGRRRLSGFLPVQLVYPDFYMVDDYWPDFKRERVEDTLKQYAAQDATLGGWFFDKFQRVIVFFQHFKINNARGA